MTITAPQLATGASGWTDQVNQFFAELAEALNGLRPIDGLNVVGDIAVSGTVDLVDVLNFYTAFLDHSARHENGGADEISVAGLSGLLADGQTPLAHALGTAHSADTLANLNAKISDANVDDDGDPRAPTNHAAKHKADGADPIRIDELKAATDIVTLNASITAHGLLRKLPNVAAQFMNGAGAWAVPAAGAGMNFVDRGDPDAYDWLVGNFTTNGAWHELDCSAIVPAGAVAILFRQTIRDDLAGVYFLLNKNGNANEYAGAVSRTAVANMNIDLSPVVACDTNRKVQYAATNTTWSSIALCVAGWWIPA